MDGGRVLVTGCSSGIGRAAALRLARDGYAVVATARRAETLADLPVAARLALDVTDPDSVEAARAAAGAVDVLVNNAGLDASGPLERFPIEHARQLFETNVLGALRTIQAFVPGMRERGAGTVVNVSSISGRVAPPLGGAYAASKYALEALSESLHYEVGHFGIRVVIVQPGFFATRMRERKPHFGEEAPPYDELRRLWEGGEAKLAGARPGPERVADAIAAAVADPGPPLRRPVGDDAELVLATRSKLDDERFEASMRAYLGLDW